MPTELNDGAPRKEPLDDAMRLVAPDLRPALDLLPDLGALSNETLADVRQSLAPRPMPESSSGLHVEDILIASRDDGEVRGLLYVPDEPSGAALVYLHGGGFVSGSAQRDDAITRRLASEFGLVLLSVNYRLAPEHPYPAALDDAFDALVWLHDHARSLGVDAARIGVRGNSAGGGLAASLALRARDAGGPSIRWLGLVYPMLDDRTEAHPHAGRHVWTAQANAWAWRAYLGEAARAAPAVPARVETLEGFPPTWIGIGDIDLFSEESLTFASRLIRAGVPTDLCVYAGAFHGFFLIPSADASRRFEHDFTQAMIRGLALNPETPS